MSSAARTLRRLLLSGLTVVFLLLLLLSSASVLVDSLSLGGRGSRLSIAPFSPAQLGPLAEAIVPIVLFALFLLSLGLLVLDFAAAARERRALLLLRDAGGSLSLDPAAVRDLARREAMAQPEVVACTMGLRRDRGGIQLVGELIVEPAANFVDVAKAARERIRAAVERSLGQSVAGIELNCRIGSGWRWQRPALHWQKGELKMQTQVLELLGRLGPVAAVSGATLAVLLGVLIIVMPAILAWLVGICLILAGVAVLVAVLMAPPEQAEHRADAGSARSRPAQGAR